MNPAKRIIPCLDIKDGRTVKGTNFVDLKDAGDPIELATNYAEQGADELVFLDISATAEKRKTLIPLVERIASVLNIPFTVGGGVRTVEDAAALLRAGADKISVNSALFRDRTLASKIADRFGSQCLVAAIDAKWNGRFQEVFLSGGREATGVDLFAWAAEIVGLGAGEVLYTSMDHDGTRQGFALSELRKLNTLLQVPVIASGGAGTPAHFAAVLQDGIADAALAAGVFHFGKISLPELKQELKAKGICVRI